MRAFLDTSALAKRYVLEKGTSELQELLSDVEIVVVAPIFLVELFSLINRRVRRKEISRDQVFSIKAQVDEDIKLFDHVLWEGFLLETSLALVEKYPLASLDAIHLASACISQPDIFVTSDKELYLYAKEELKHARLI